jgi:ribosomal protein L11 methyltransferase
MSAATWYICGVMVARPDAERLMDELRDALAMEPVAIEKAGSDETWLELYYEDAAAAEQALAQLRDAPGILAAAVRRCDARDWEVFWQKHFRPQRVGQRLLICPEWALDELPPDWREGRQLLRMVPGLSFGTGEHFTTRFCLEAIEQLTTEASITTVWDVGCGSGILGVAAALLGVPQVLGTDNDPVCLEQAAENARLNGVTAETEWRQADILDPEPGRFDLVCANLFATLLLRSAPALWEATGRYLVMSGIREIEVDAVAETFVALGATERVRDGDGEWAGLLMERCAR